MPWWRSAGSSRTLATPVRIRPSAHLLTAARPSIRRGLQTSCSLGTPEPRTRAHRTTCRAFRAKFLGLRASSRCCCGISAGRRPQTRTIRTPSCTSPRSTTWELNLYRRWDKSKPPQGPFTLNKDSWRAQGLVHWFPMGGPSSLTQQWDLCSGMLLSGSSIVSLDLGAAGEPVSSLATSSVWAKTGGVTVTAAPLMVGMWCKPTDVTTNKGLFTSGQFAGFINRWQMDFNAGSLRWIAATGSVGAASVSAGAVNVWHHYLGVEISNASRYAQTDGVPGAQETTVSTPSSVDQISVGALAFSSSYSNYVTALIGEVCIWNNTMDALQRANLADQGSRFDLWYPLRNRKWFSVGTASTFKPFFANQLGGFIGVGVS